MREKSFFCARIPCKKTSGCALAGRSYPDYSPEKPPSYSMLVEPFLRERLPQLIQVKGKKEAVVVPGTEELRAVCAKYDIATNSDNAGQ